MYSVPGDTTSLVPGFPIRTSSDQRSVGSSPRLIAASNVLHRLPVPRHPPCALKHLQRYLQTNLEKLHIHTPTPAPSEKDTNPAVRDARNHYPQIKHHTPPPKQGDNSPSAPTGTEQQGLLSQSPIVCLMIPAPASPPANHVCCCTRTGATTATGPSNESLHSPNPHDLWAG